MRKMMLCAGAMAALMTAPALAQHGEAWRSRMDVARSTGADGWNAEAAVACADNPTSTAQLCERLRAFARIEPAFNAGTGARAAPASGAGGGAAGAGVAAAPGSTTMGGPAERVPLTRRDQAAAATGAGPGAVAPPPMLPMGNGMVGVPTLSARLPNGGLVTRPLDLTGGMAPQ